MKRWEYKRFRFADNDGYGWDYGHNGKGGNLLPALNEAGAEGWELITDPQASSGGYCLMKREVVSGHEENDE